MAKRPNPTRIVTGAGEKRPAADYAPWAIGAALVLAIGIIFGQTLDHGLLTFDDSGYVTDNPYVYRGITGEGIWWAITDGPYGDWFPVTMLSHMLDCQIFGLSAWGHHLVNVLLHAADSVGLFLLCRRMTAQRAVPGTDRGLVAAGYLPTAPRGRGVASGVRADEGGPKRDSIWPSALVAALFAVHPQHVESVAWIAERRDVLSGLFFVLTLWAWLDYVARGRTVARYLLVTLLLTLGLLSKPMLVTLPPLLVLLDFWPLGRWGRGIAAEEQNNAPANQTGKRQQSINQFSPIAVGPAEQSSLLWLLVEKLPLLAVSAGVCLMTMRHGALGKPHFDWSLRIGGAATSVVAYIADMVYPAKLFPFYCYPEGGFPLWKTAGSLALLLAISTAAWIWRRRYPAAFVGWFWFLGMLVPVLGLVTISGHLRADRYTYLPSIGLYLALALGGTRLADRLPRRKWLLAASVAVALVVLVVCSARQAAIWRNDETLWRETLARDPHNAKAEFALATALANRGETDEAIALYRRAEEHPIDVAPFCNLGAILVSQGKTDEAIAQYRQALAMEPGYYAAHINLGIALLTQQHPAEAREHFQTALAIQPLGVEARCGLAHVLLAEGKMDEARAEFERALATGLRSAPAHADLAAVLLWQGDVTGARLHCEAALAIAPKYFPAHLELAKALAAGGQPREAAQHYLQVLELSPGNLLARRGLDELQSRTR